MTLKSCDFKVIIVKGLIPMPKQTFFNLPEEKRRKIETAALDEFARHGFKSSNMNRIVAVAGIAKGSFYQYFEDKKDLYFHLIEVTGQEKIRRIQPVLDAHKKHSFLHNLGAIFRVGLDYAYESPKLYQVGEDFARSNMDLMAEFIEKYKPQGEDIFMLLLRGAVENGEVDEALNLPLTASFIGTLITQTSVGLLAAGAGRPQMETVLEELLRFIQRAIATHPMPDKER